GFKFSGDQVTHIQESVDYELLQQRLDHTETPMVPLAEYVRHFVELIIAQDSAEKEPETREWLDGRAARLLEAPHYTMVLPETFEYLFAKITEIKRECADFHLKQLSAVLQFNQAYSYSDYFRDKFEQSVEESRVSVAETESWFRETRDQYPDNTVQELNRIGLRDVVLQTEPLTLRTVPETYHDVLEGTLNVMQMNATDIPLRTASHFVINRELAKHGFRALSQEESAEINGQLTEVMESDDFSLANLHAAIIKIVGDKLEFPDFFTPESADRLGTQIESAPSMATIRLTVDAMLLSKGLRVSELDRNFLTENIAPKLAQLPIEKDIVVMRLRSFINTKLSDKVTPFDARDKAFQAEITAHVKPDGPVVKLLATRMKAFIGNLISKTESEKSENGSGFGLLKPCFSDIQFLATQIFKVSEMNFGAHKARYESLLQE
ncbi:MAG: hypothetical protein ACI9BD_000987, partial [Candidatus Marinamargulisbacteria bacterium]